MGDNELPTDPQSKISHNANITFDSYKKRYEQKNLDLKKTILQQNIQSFRQTVKKGPRRPGKKNYAKKYYCCKCRIHYNTSLRAIILHKSNHDVDGIVKIGVIKTGGYKGFFRPQEHAYNSRTGKYYRGPESRLYSIRYPDNLLVGDRLTCPNCDYSIPLVTQDGTLSLRAQAIRVERFRLHRSKCECKRSRP